MEKTFDQIINFRLFTSELDKIDGIIKLIPDKYENRSHYIRCAVINQIREDIKEIKQNGS